jgi:hypothetical protein
MTLRVRLLLGLVVLAAIGLAVAGAVTYHEQQTFFSKRVNDQLTSALANPQQFSSTFGDRESPAGAYQRNLPFGTYAEVRFPDGTIQTVSTDSVSNSARSSRCIIPATVHSPAGSPSRHRRMPVPQFSSSQYRCAT